MAKTKQKSARARQQARLGREFLKGYRLGFDKGYADGRSYGHSELRTQLRELLGVGKGESQ